MRLSYLVEINLCVKNSIIEKISIKRLTLLDRRNLDHTANIIFD